MSRAWPRAALGLGAALLVLGAAARARAETDFLPASSDWNGTSELVALAQGLQLQLETPLRVSWDELAADREAVLIWIYPRAELPVTQLLRFLNRGGRLLVADDFGGAATLLARFGIRRFEDQRVRAARLHEGNPDLPLAARGPVRHPLLEGVEEVVANHPAFFRSALPTLLGFDDGRQQLLVAGDVGRGRLVALADPSALINNMLRFRGNRRLAVNLLRYLAQPGQRVLLLVGRAELHGELPAAGSAPRRADGRRLNALLERVNDFALTAEGMRVLGFGCAVLALCAIVLLLPWPRRDFDGHWVRPGALPAPGEPVDATWAAAVLREELEERLTALLAAPGPVSALHPRWIVDRVRRQAGAEAAAVCERLLSSLRQVPYTAPTGALLGQGRVSHRELALIYDQAAALLRALGANDLQPLADGRGRGRREEGQR